MNVAAKAAAGQQTRFRSIAHVNETASIVLAAKRNAVRSKGKKKPGGLSPCLFSWWLA